MLDDTGTGLRQSATQLNCLLTDDTASIAILAEKFFECRS